MNEFLCEEARNSDYQPLVPCNHQFQETASFPYKGIFTYSPYASTGSSPKEDKSMFEFGNQDFTIITKEYPKVAGRNDIPYYPVNDEVNNKRYKKYKKLSEGKNVVFGGRLAEYKYYDMHQVIGSALYKAKKEINKKSLGV